MFLKLEDGSFINLSLISRVEFYDGKGECAMFNAGVREGDNSKVAYKFFMALRKGESLSDFVLVPLPGGNS